MRHKAAARIYDIAMSSGELGALWFEKMKAEEKRYASALASTRITVDDGVQATPSSIGISRR